jgi:hypothetical protein
MNREEKFGNRDSVDLNPLQRWAEICPPTPAKLDINCFSNLNLIVYFDTKIADSALDLRVTEQYLDGS